MNVPTSLEVSACSSFRGIFTVPGDKSISHRALMLAAISRGRTDIRGFLPAVDCLATLRCLRAMGVQVDELSDSHLIVHGNGLQGLAEPEDVLDCDGSGTTMRLLAGILAGRPSCSILTGNAQLRQRPMSRITGPLRSMGATVHGRDNGRLPPLFIRGGHLKGIDYTLPVASAQVKSAILLAGMQASGRTTIREPGPARDHTERMLKARGAAITSDGNGVVSVTAGRDLAAVDVLVPGDISSAAFFIVAACLIPHSEIVLRDIGVNPTRTGILDVLRDMGADITLTEQRKIGGEPVADILVRSSALRATAIGGATIPRVIDELPLLALAASQAEGVTTISDAAELRVKETNRIDTTAKELRKLASKIEVQPDGFVIEGPTPLQGTHVDSQGDHRLAMTLAIAGLLARGRTVVHDTACIADSFPDFETMLPIGIGSFT